MISPFSEVRNFLVFLEIDGEKIELAEVAQKVREAALIHYRLDFDGDTFRVSGRLRLEQLFPQAKLDAQLLRALTRLDEGQSLYTFLADPARKRKPSGLCRSPLAGWFVEYGYSRSLSVADKARRSNGEVASPGPFHGEVDSVSLAPNPEHHTFDKLADFKNLVKNLAGIRVYRDGFGIRVGEDWLGLGKQQTTASSYYGLRPGNVLGFVALTARDNEVLTETTSREGFQQTPAYENFYFLLTDFVKFAQDAQDYLRRGTLDFIALQKESNEKISKDDSNADIRERIKRLDRNLSEKRDRLNKYRGTLARVTTTAKTQVAKARTTLGKALAEDVRLKSAVNEIDKVIHDISVVTADAEDLAVQVESALQGATELNKLREHLDRRWDRLREELGALFESVSLGLTAEALTHEINNIADSLNQKSANVLRQVTGGELRKPAIVAYIEHVRSSIAAMRRQLAHLTPSLKYVRERRERLSLWAVLEELSDFHNERLNRKKEDIRVALTGGSSTYISVNKGKLVQVFDNLILNSIYWIEESLRVGLIPSGKISIEVHRGTIRIYDNGRGVDPNVEENLFEPFVTMKERSEGRGLGLFVVQQLLDSENCGVILLPERNGFGRRYAFEIDLSGVLCD